jgi:hypothetical protein
MKLFLVKTVIIFVAAFILFQITIGSTITELKSSLNSISDRNQRDMFKEKIKKEMKKGIEKENYFTEEERLLISNFLKKILKELELIDKNK